MVKQSAISNFQVYGLEESMTAGMYPMSTDTEAMPDTGRIIDRAKALGRAKSGSGHDCMLKGITVQFNWKNSLLIQRQVLRYHFLDIVSSQSTMHRALQMDIGEQVNYRVHPVIIETCEELIQEYNYAVKHGASLAELKERELELLYSLPSGYELTARYTTNYLQLKTVYLQRRTHKLPEWREFCAFIEQLPMFLTLTGITPLREELES